MNPTEVFEKMESICQSRRQVYDHERFRKCFGESETEISESWQRLYEYLLHYEKHPRGLALIGTPGIGKTLFMHAMEAAANVKVWLPDFIINRAISKKPMDVFFADKVELRIDGNGKAVRQPTVSCFDGVGDRNAIWTDFGTIKNPYEEILYERGSRSTKTHLTSNMSDEEFISVYGQRVWSRLNGICEIFVLIGPDCRIYKPKADIREAQRFS